MIFGKGTHSLQVAMETTGKLKKFTEGIYKEEEYLISRNNILRN